MFSKLFEPQINGNDVAIEIEATVSDDSFDHHFGTEKIESFEFEAVCCEGCTPREASMWIHRNKSRLVEWAQNELEEARMAV